MPAAPDASDALVAAPHADGGETTPSIQKRSSDTKKIHRRKKGVGIPKATFTRILKTIGNDMKSDLLWQPEAIEALQEASEHMLEQRFFKANQLAKLCKVDTITAAHFQETRGK